jgi:hypothetical protein
MKSFIPKQLGNKIVDFDEYKRYLKGKYRNEKYTSSQFCCAYRHFDCLLDASKLLSIAETNRMNVLKALVALSKYIGVYDEFKLSLKRYDIKWSNGDNSFNSFLRIFNHKHDTLPAYLREIQPHLKNNEKIYLKFLALTGLRVVEAMMSFNKIIELYSDGKLDDYYNKDMQVLEHFKFKEIFIRGTKNAYISFVNRELVKEICRCKPVTYQAVYKQLLKKKLKMRLKELRSFNNTFLYKNGLLSEVVDICAGRIPKSVFIRHYFSADMEELSKQVLTIQEGLEEALFGF